MRGHRADRVDVLLDIPGNKLAMAPPAAFQVHNMGGVADGAAALGDLLALPGEALVLVTRGFHRWGDLRQACGALRRTARATLGPHVMSHIEVRVRLLARRFGLGDCLGGSPLFGSPRA